MLDFALPHTSAAALILMDGLARCFPHLSLFLFSDSPWDGLRKNKEFGHGAWLPVGLVSQTDPRAFPSTRMNLQRWHLGQKNPTQALGLLITLAPSLWSSCSEIATVWRLLLQAPPARQHQKAPICSAAPREQSPGHMLPWLPEVPGLLSAVFPSPPPTSRHFFV